MESNNGEYIKADFTFEELDLISQRAEHLAKSDEINIFWQQAYWALALSANTLSIMLENEEKETIGLKSADVNIKDISSE